MNAIRYYLRNTNGWNVQSKLSINVEVLQCVGIVVLGNISNFDEIVRSLGSMKIITLNRSSPPERVF